MNARITKINENLIKDKFPHIQITNFFINKLLFDHLTEVNK